MNAHDGWTHFINTTTQLPWILDSLPSIVGNLEKRGRSICRVQQDGERGRALAFGKYTMLLVLTSATCFVLLHRQKAALEECLFFLVRNQFLRPSRSKKERSVEVEVANHIKPPEILLGLKTAPSQVQLGTNLSDTSMLCLVLRSQAAASLQSYVAMPMKVLLVAMSDLLCGDITRSQVRNLRQDIFWACFLGRLTVVPHASSHATLGGVGASSEARIHGADQSVWDHAAPLACCQVGCFFSCFFTC